MSPARRRFWRNMRARALQGAFLLTICGLVGVAFWAAQAASELRGAREQQFAVRAP